MPLRLNKVKRPMTQRCCAMDRSLLASLALAFSVLAGAAAAIASQEPTSGRQAELSTLLKHDCGSCHGLTLKGGLGPALLPGALKDKPTDFLVEVILDGVPGTPMPPWRGELTAEEALWLAQSIKRGTE